MRLEQLEKQVAAYRPKVMSEIARWGLGREDCEDICSRTVVKMFRACDRIDDDRPFLNFWLRAAQREVLDFRKVKRNEPTAPMPEEDEWSDPHTGDIEIDESEVYLNQHMAMLPKELHEVFYLIVVEGLNQADAGRMLGQTKDWIHHKWTRIKRILREKVEHGQ